MDWRWTVEGGCYVLRPRDLPPGLAEAGFVGRALEPGAPGPLGARALAHLPQLHGADVHWADRPGRLQPGDAIRTATPGFPLAVRVADCIPVILASGRDGIALVHAGWRGLVAGVIEAAVATFREAGRIRAILGPAIGVCCFEVGNEVADRFPPETTLPRTPRPHVDLGRSAAARLRRAGVDRILAAPVCTRCHQHLAHSHRGSGGGPGRVVAFAVAAGSPGQKHDS